MCMSRLQGLFLLHNIMNKQQKSKRIQGISKNLFSLLPNVYSVLQKHLGGKTAATGHEGAVKTNISLSRCAQLTETSLTDNIRGCILRELNFYIVC